MKDNNKHPHHDLIVEWIKDTSKIIQVKKGVDEWSDCNPMSVYWLFSCEYRFKPREFVKGYWYPCIEIGEKTSRGYPRLFDGINFIDWEDDICPLDVSQFKWIGESLGEIKFGD